jgi:hypothetical protein
LDCILGPRTITQYFCKTTYGFYIFSTLYIVPGILKIYFKCSYENTFYFLLILPKASGAVMKGLQKQVSSHMTRFLKATVIDSFHCFSVPFAAALGNPFMWLLVPFRDRIGAFKMLFNDLFELEKTSSF